MPQPNYMKEGWGIAYSKRAALDYETNELTRNEQVLYTTDSSDKINVIDPNTWRTIEQIYITKLSDDST